MGPVAAELDQVNKEFSASIGAFVGVVYSNYQLMLSRKLRQHGLHKYIRPGVGPLLFRLFERDGITIRTASESLGLPFTTVASIVRRMQSRGLLKVERSPDDGRQVSLRLTAQAQALRDRCYALGREVNAELLDGIEGQQVLQAVTVFRRLNENAILSHKGDASTRGRRV